MAKVSKSSILAPIVLIVIYIIFLLILRNIFPTGKTLVDYLASIYGRFGYEIVIIGSFLEALMVINFFIPGVAAVGLGVIFAKAGELDLTLAIILAVIGALTGYMLNYSLGRFGFGELLDSIGYEEAINKAEAQIEQSGLKAFSLGFIHPNIGALIAFAAGTLRVNFKTFLLLALLSTTVWYIIWGLLIFALGEVFLTIFNRYVVILFMLVGAIWILGILYGGRKSNIKNKNAK